MSECANHGLYVEALELFRGFLERASQAMAEANAMALATCDQAGTPAVRMVLLKQFDARGFCFYTNLGSRKSQMLSENPHAALCFYWQPLKVQVRVEGLAERVSDQEADTYFATRPRDTQIGAWASRQSEELEARDVLEKRTNEFKARFDGSIVSRPSYWSGFRVVPDRIEFWQGRESRLHDRTVYQIVESVWQKSLLFP